MLEKIEDEEILLMEGLSNPLSAIEIIFDDLENCTYSWDEKLAHVRFAQFGMLNFEFLLDEDPNLDPNPQINKKLNFQLHEGMGNIDCFGGRNFGKSWIIEVIDMLISSIWLDNVEAGFTSSDAIHIRGILEEKFIPIITKHPFFLMLLPESANKGINRSPAYRIAFKNGFTITGINMNVQSRNPGNNFFQKHLKRLYVEEATLEVQEVFDKRQESRHEVGCVIRSAGMTAFTAHSPVGKRFNDLKNKPWVCNLPQYSNPNFDEKEKQKAIKKYGGENSVGFRVYVKGEVVEDGISTFDMSRVILCYNEDRSIKNFEITKENFHNFENIVVIDKPSGIDQVLISADIGISAATEICIFFRKEEKYKYEYNITCFNLTDKEQTKIFMFLSQKLGASLVGIDTTEGTGRAIYRTLAESYSTDNLCWVSFSEKIIVDYEKDDKGAFKFDENGNLIPVYEYVSEWSIKHLKTLFYEKEIECPLDYKLDVQLRGCIGWMSGSRMCYTVDGSEDHLLAAFRVFAIAVWQNHFKTIKPINIKKFFKGVV